MHITHRYTHFLEICDAYSRYFLSRVETVLLPDYLPTNQDIVQVRVKTTGIIEHDFEISMQGNNKRKLILVIFFSEVRFGEGIWRGFLIDRCGRSEEREKKVDPLLRGRHASALLNGRQRV